MPTGQQSSHHTPERPEQATNVFHGASGFEIQGGQFNSAAGNIIMQLPRAPNVEQVQTRNTASFIPPIIVEERESATYARLLWSKGRGYPLWSPKPPSNLPEEYTAKGVHIGDVGIITADGAFDFLFNICKPANHPINCNGVPPEFVPLSEPDPSTVASDIEFPAGSYLMSKSMEGGPSSSSAISSNNEGEELSYSFISYGAEGALVLLPEGALRQDLQSLSRFRRYAARNGGSWYKYANGERLGRETSNGSIHLVTGFDKSRSWAVAAFSNAQLAHDRRQIRVKLNGQEVHTQAGRSYYWNQMGPARIKYGPVPIGPSNQCVFLRSFNISLSMRLWGKVFGIIDVTKTTDVPFERFSPDNPCIPFQGGSPPFLWEALSRQSSSSSSHLALSQQFDMSQDQSEPDVLISQTFVSGISRHPGRTVNNVLLRNRPDAEVAICHDDQWAPLACKVDNIDEDAVSQHILANFSIEVEDGAVFLSDAINREKPPPPILYPQQFPSLFPAKSQVKTLEMETPASPWLKNSTFLESQLKYDFPVPAGPKLKSATLTKSRDDSWKRRPSAAEIYERLDEFFPDEDLDEPVVEETSAGISHTETKPDLEPTRKPIRSPKEGNSPRNLTLAKSFIENRSTKRELVRLTKAMPGSTSAPWLRGELIDRGTSGRVYVALNDCEVIAVKQIDISREDIISVLKSQSETMKDLDHPNIVQYLGFEETPRVFNIFMEYVPGSTIGRCLQMIGKFDDTVTRFFTSQILSGLDYLHHKGIFHRNLNDKNILVEMQGQCKISDFSLMIDDLAGDSPRGPVYWMPPEVVKAQKKIDNAKVDIWSVGCIVVAMWTGMPPWEGQNAIAVLFQLSQAKSPPPLPVDFILSEAADDFRSLCFSMNPEERPSAADLRKHAYLELSPDWEFTGFTSQSTRYENDTIQF